MRFDEAMTPAEKVEWAWLWLLHQARLEEPVREMVRAAYARPVLRALFPYMSLRKYLRFSRTTRVPYTWDHPYVQFVDGGDNYVVRAGKTNIPILESGSLSAALDALVAALPPTPDAVTDDDPSVFDCDDE